MRASVLFVPLIFAGCFESSSNDVVGPFNGASHRFVVDGFTLPLSSSEARRLGGDLNGDGTADNQAGSVIGTMAGQLDVTTHTADMIAAGALASHVEILADSLASDDHVGVLYFGADGDQPIAAGGRFDEAGVFVSNRTRNTSAPGHARIRLPVFREADPLDLDVEAMEIDLVPDGTGYVATIHGAIRGTDAADVAADGILQMVASNPGDHLNMWSVFDALPHDGVITKQEVLTNTLFESMMAPDLDLFGGSIDDAVSIGFQVHLRPALSGDPPDAPCFDRVQDGDETDVDCGGSCGACSGGATCGGDLDCATGGCSEGTCLEATCSDGHEDGFETDIDCGGACAFTEGKTCANGQACKFASDCAVHSQCDVARGICVPGV